VTIAEWSAVGDIVGRILAARHGRGQAKQSCSTCRSGSAVGAHLDRLTRSGRKLSNQLNNVFRFTIQS
jgi:hypothetical protein